MLRPVGAGEVPAETAKLAGVVFPKGCLAMRVRDVLGPLFDDAEFAGLFSTRGRPAVSPGRLALVSVLQFVEGLTDRQASHAVRARIDWKYALGLELTDEGFDHSVLCEFRARLVESGSEHRVLDAILDAARRTGLLKAGGRARTDSTHVLAATRDVNRLEFAVETLRAALNAVAAVAGGLADRPGRAGLVRPLQRPSGGHEVPVTVGRSRGAWPPGRRRRHGAVASSSARRGLPASGLVSAVPGRGRDRALADVAELPAGSGPVDHSARSRRPHRGQTRHRLGRLQGPHHRDLRTRRSTPDHHGQDHERGRGRHGADRGCPRSTGRQEVAARGTSGRCRIRRRRSHHPRANRVRRGSDRSRSS